MLYREGSRPDLNDKIPIWLICVIVGASLAVLLLIGYVIYYQFFRRRADQIPEE